MKTPVYYEPDPSFTTLDYTYAWSRYSCVGWVYPLHIIFAYLVLVTGFLALLSRVIPKLTPYHTMFGRWFILFMLWCMASSLLIYTAGLPFPIIISFVYLLVSMTIGWNAIKVHASRLKQQISKSINAKMSDGAYEMKEFDIEKF